MRILVAVGLIFLVGSALFAPQVRRSRKTGPDPALFADTDPRARIELGEAESALGVAYSGYEELSRTDPDDLDALRGRIRTGLTIAAAAPDRAEAPRLIREQVDEYLARREILDPDGTLLHSILDRWVEIRLEHPSFFLQSSYAVPLAARGDERGQSRIDRYVREGPFERHIFNLARLLHLHWDLVGPLVEHYLARDGKEALDGRVQAALTLLEYNRVHGLGQELLDANRDRIRASFREVIEGLGPVRRSPTMLQMGVNALQGLALLREAQDIETIRGLNPVRYGAFADLIRIVKMWVGLDSFSRFEVGGVDWGFLSPPSRALYFRAGAHELVRLGRVDTSGMTEKERAAHAAALEEARLIVDAGSIDSDSTVRVYSNYMRAVADPEEAPAHLRRVVAAGDATAIFAGVLAGLDDPVPALLPGLNSNEPEVVALVAVALLRLDGPIPLQPYSTNSRER
jgi:hypothetical protein